MFEMVLERARRKGGVRRKYRLGWHYGIIVLCNWRRM